MEAFLDRLMQAHGCELPPKDDTSGAPPAGAPAFSAIVAIELDEPAWLPSPFVLGFGPGSLPGFLASRVATRRCCALPFA